MSNKKKSNKKSTYKKGSNKKTNSKSKKGLFLAIIATVVAVAALAVVLTLALGGKNKQGRNLLKSEGKHITVTGEQRLIQLCDKIASGIAYTETYTTDGMKNYYTCDGTKNYNRATFTDENYSWDVAELFDGTSGYAIDHTNKSVSKFDTDYKGIQSISMMGVYATLRDTDNLKYVESSEEEFEGTTCYVESYSQTSSLTGENTIKAYFYEDTLVAIVTVNQYNTITEYVEIVEGADASYFTYEKPEGYTENF